MIYLLAIFLPPLGLLLNGQPFSAILNAILIVPCILLGLAFPRSARHFDEARGPQAPGGGGGDREARCSAEIPELTTDGPLHAQRPMLTTLANPPRQRFLSLAH